ncbi:hypothetical protein V8C35DRAFT_171631 [Trichoderma chlorosporum]
MRRSILRLLHLCGVHWCASMIWDDGLPPPFIYKRVRQMLAINLLFPFYLYLFFLRLYIWKNDRSTFHTNIEIGCSRILEVKLHSLYLGVEREICLILHAHMKAGTQSLEVCHKAFSGGLHCYDEAQGYHSLFYRHGHDLEKRLIRGREGERERERERRATKAFWIELQRQCAQGRGMT